MFINSNKKLKKVLIMLLVIALTYSNFLLVGVNGIKGLFSYALEDEDTESLEVKIENEEIFNFSKSNIEYEESWIASIKTVDSNKLTIEQRGNRFLDHEENELNSFNSLYKSTIINKIALLEILGETGELSIYNKDSEELIIKISKDVIDEIQEEQNEVTEEDNENVEIQPIIINEDNVTINYQTEVTNVYIEITNLDNNMETTLTVTHNKVLNVVIDEQEEIEDEEQYILSAFENLNNVETTIKAVLEGTNNQELFIYSIKKPVTKPFSKAKMGIDKENLSIVNENNVIYTITLYTEKEGYNLFNNPNFEILLPNYVENVSINSVDIVNNQKYDETLIFTQNNRVEDNKLLINLQGAQEEHTTVPSENVQVVINATIKTKTLMPTTEDVLTLQYQNGEEQRQTKLPVKFETDAIVITALNARTQNQIATSMNGDYKTVTVNENEEQKVVLTNTIINNTQDNLEGAKILGKCKNVGQISLENAQIYYSQNENATENLEDEQNGWVNEYIENAKAYLIVLNIAQKQTVNYSYEMVLPEDITEDQVYNVSYVVLDNQNVKKAETKIEVNQETSLDNNLNTEAEDEKISMSLNTRVLDATYDQEFETASLGSIVEYIATIENKSNENMENVTLEINLSNDFNEQVVDIHINEKDEIENCQLAYYYSSYDNSVFKDTDCILSINDRKVTISGVVLEANKEYELVVQALVDNNVKDTINTIIKLSHEDETLRVKSEVLVNNPLQVTANIVSDKTNEALNAGDEINFVIEVTAEGEGYADVNIEPIINNLLKVTKYTITIIDNSTEDNAETSESESQNGINTFNTKVRLTANKTIRINATATVEETGRNTEVSTFANIIGKTIQDVRTNVLTNVVNAKPGFVEVPQTNIEDGKEATQENPSENEPENPGEENDNNEDNGTYSISGVAWLDENKNGQREDIEKLLPNVGVKLLKVQTNELIKATKTDEQGEYKFKDLEEGNYYLVFEYNNISYSLTEYNKFGVAENLNSDAILTTEDNKNTSKTNILTIKDKSLKNIDIGLLENELVDLEINKYINKVVVSNNEGTTTYNYNKSKTANVSIGRKVFNGSTVVVEYAIDITNNGDVPTYAKSIEDVLPSQLTFNTELNNSWFKDNDGTLRSVELAQEVINPGETKTIILIASIVTTDKAQTLVNNVKIGEIFNSKLIQEKDTKNNESQASLLITVNTGNAKLYMALVIAFIAIIGAGIVVINKKILLK